MADLAFDVLEEIMVRLDVKDLIQCKSVCKSWLSFISTHRFVRAHLNHNIKDPCIYNGGYCKHCLIGSKKKDMIRHIKCWGFGYDSSSDDYKVVVGLRKARHTKRTTFHVLTLKSNAWKVIGELEYQYIYVRKGILCDGVLYWFITNENYKERIIISLDLSTEELKEIPQPDDADYNNSPFCTHQLGLVQECLCIQSCPSRESSNIWVMKNKWELYIDRQQSKYDVAHCLSRVCDSQKKGGKHDPHRLNIVWGDSQKRRGHVYGFIRHYDERHVPCNVWDCIIDGIFVKSLVSPHPHVDEGPNKVPSKCLFF
ncbi:F-box/kelch-repeat protein At3g06240-like [Bidens hawaiensis]|uniref:F-box/kelch-repeat protein At3g06240-like n=1 Tax=Bidens hawaiensis TaxID=980011 RepID=UPI00404A3209